ncbi:MAG: cytochrome C biogenesis protein CcsB [Thermus sp.]|uniref:Rieske 2Fe-2S domain-containing protein n=1 Tax=Thermus sp. TaxID=275 RepID=UPI0033332461
MRRRDLVFLLPVGAALGFFTWFGVRTYNLRFRPRPEPKEPRWKPGPKVLVARLSELPAPWSVKPFLYPLPQGPLQSILLRTPLPVQGGVSVNGLHLVAFSRICTHQGCTVNFVPDPEAGSLLYNYRSETPFLGCPCHFGAFDPLKAGEAVYGPPRHPLPRLRLEVVGKEVYATGHEVPLRPLEVS